MTAIPEASAVGGRPAFGALAGLRVIDLSRVLAGPLCTQMLADHGADVIKIEPPSGDETRTLGPPFAEGGEAAYFTAVNRGKRDIALDLSKREGQEILLRLLEDADVLVENFIPGTMERWGLAYETTLRERFPSLIYCSISGFGNDGPLGGLPGYDAILQAMCGLMSVNGDEQIGPTRVGVPVVDHLTGYSALVGILMAVIARGRTGFGQRVEATLFDTALSLLVPHAANWMYSGKAPGLLGSAHPNIAPYDKLSCGDGKIFLGILNDRQFRRFCEHVGLAWLADDERFRSNAQRLQHRDELKEVIEATLQSWSRAGLCEQLMKIGVPVGPVNNVPEAFAQAHAAHRGMRVQGDGYQGVGVATKLYGTPGRAEGSPPAHGQHNLEVLREAGYGDDEIAVLAGSGAVPGLLP